MLNEEELKNILENNPKETYTIEYKRDWYWDNDTLLNKDKEKNKGKDQQKLWDEFLKDLLALANANLGYVGKTRYLIVGYDEKTSTKHDVNPDKISDLTNLTVFRNNISKKLKSRCNTKLEQLEIYFVDCENKSKRLLIFEIPSPTVLIELTIDLQSKSNKVFSANTVFIRKFIKNGKDGEEISVQAASVDEATKLKNEFEIYKNKIQKNRSIVSTIESYIENNRNYSYAQNMLSTTDTNQGIVYEVFKFNVQFGNPLYFVYINQYSRQAKTYQYLIDESIIEKNCNLIILTEEPEDVNPETRKDNLRKIFKTKDVYFIDEFGYEFIYKGYMSSYEPFNISVFVESFLDSNDSKSEKKTALQILNDWYNSISEPILVIKGHGGIGKSTLVKYFLDSIYAKNSKNNSKKEVGILFIDSNDIIKGLLEMAKSVPNKSFDNIYDFYQALINKGNPDYFLSKPIPKNVLQLAVDQGRLIIVLDGIDEVISKLGSYFNIKAFLQSIKSEYCANLEKAKIIITCRDYFWEKLDNDSNIREIDLSPFNQKMAEDFFEQSYSNLLYDCNQNLNKNSFKKLKIKSMDLAKDIAMSDKNKYIATETQEEIYIPYMLDMIADIVKKDKFDKFSPDQQDSNFLEMNIKNDYIIEKFCNREITKLGNRDNKEQDKFKVDNQIRLFCDMALYYSGIVNIHDIKYLLDKVGICKQETDCSNYINRLKGHPIINSNQDSIFFRYDFFKTHFNSIAIGHFLKQRNAEQVKDKVFAEALINYVKFDSNTTIEIIKRFDYNEDMILFMMECIQNINTCDEYDQNFKNSVISVLFIIILLSVQKLDFANYGKEKCRDILINIFERSNEIHGLCLIDIYPFEKYKFIFDFKDLVFVNCTFDNYSFFWDCDFNENNKFINCNFYRIPSNNKSKIPLKLEQFEGGDYDCITKIIRAANQNYNTHKETVISELKSLLLLFRRSGTFHSLRQEQLDSKQKYNKYVETLLKEGVLEETHQKKHPQIKCYKIADNYKDYLSKVIEQDYSNFEFEQIVKLFL